MEKITVKIPFESTKEQILEATKELVHEIYKGYLGREPTTEDRPKFSDGLNADNASINNFYFEGKKYGSLATTYIVDGPKGISFEFTPEN